MAINIHATLVSLNGKGISLTGKIRQRKIGFGVADDYGIPSATGCREPAKKLTPKRIIILITPVYCIYDL